MLPCASFRRARRSAARPGTLSRKTTRSPKTWTFWSARPAAACSALISSTVARASSTLCGVTETTSAERAPYRYGRVMWATVKTTG